MFSFQHKFNMKHVSGVKITASLVVAKVVSRFFLGAAGKFCLCKPPRAIATGFTPWQFASEIAPDNQDLLVSFQLAWY